MRGGALNRFCMKQEEVLECAERRKPCSRCTVARLCEKAEVGRVPSWFECCFQELSSWCH